MNISRNRIPAKQSTPSFGGIRRYTVKSNEINKLFDTFYDDYAQIRVVENPYYQTLVNTVDALKNKVGAISPKVIIEKAEGDGIKTPQSFKNGLVDVFLLDGADARFYKNDFEYKIDTTGFQIKILQNFEKTKARFIETKESFDMKKLANGKLTKELKNRLVIRRHLRINEANDNLFKTFLNERGLDI